VRPAFVYKLKTTDEVGFGSPTLAVVFRRPLWPPRSRFLGRARQPVDGFSVPVLDVEGARAAFESVGVPWVSTIGEALARTIGLRPSG
jgi:hypothetical protein